MLRDLEDRQDCDSGKVAGASPTIARQNAPMTRGGKWSLAIGVMLILLATGLWSWHNQWWQVPMEQPLDTVIPAQAGIHNPPNPMDSHLRGNDSNPENQSATTDNTTEPTIDPVVEELEVQQPEPKPSVAQQAEKQTIADQPTEVSSAPPPKELVLQQPLPEAKQQVSAIIPSASTLDQKAADTARELVADGQFSRARRLLEQHLQQYPQAGKSALALAQLHLDNGDHGALNQLLAATSALSPAQATLLQARSLLAQQQPDNAKSLLEKSPPTVEQHPDYHALLAGLYHNSGQHRAAATLYNRLVEIQPDSPIYWLGLAVALDALRDGNALQAFQRTRALNSNPDIQRYIEQRIAALSNDR